MRSRVAAGAVSRVFPRAVQPRRVSLGIALLLLAAHPALHAQMPSATAVIPTATDLTLASYMQRVVEYNATVQAQVLAFHAARSQERAEGGTFEPTWVSTAEYQDNRQANTVEQERNLRSGGIFRERNQDYSSALEAMSPWGTKVRLGVVGNQLINNIQRQVYANLDAEYQTSAGVTIEQPLLKGFGKAANLAALRVAARASDAAFQEYRRGLMQVLADAELAYWRLYFAERETQLNAESVQEAQTILRDAQANLQAGRGSNLDVMEAQAGLALRQSRASLAQQKRVEAANQLVAFFGGDAAGGTGLSAADAPALRAVYVVPQDGLRAAEEMSPDLLRAEALAGQERVRTGYAKNQRLPELNFKTSYAQTGLATTYTSSWSETQGRNFPLWSISLELRIPIFGGIRGHNEYRAANFRLLQAERNVANLRTQVHTQLDSAEQRVAATYQAAQSYDAIVSFRQNLLNTRMQARDIGRMDTRRVLEAEQDLFSAKLDQLQSAIDYEQALLDLQMISGTLLQDRGLELARADLEAQTAAWAVNPNAPLRLRYSAPTFTRWPAVPPTRFQSDTDPTYPLRLRLARHTAQN